MKTGLDPGFRFGGLTFGAAVGGTATQDTAGAIIMISERAVQLPNLPPDLNKVGPQRWVYLPARLGDAK